MARNSGAFVIVLCLAVVALAGAAGAQVSLGSFSFAADQFGDALVESDGGSFSSGNWLNTVNADPGNPGYLTGANFDTGIANIGLTSEPTYTILYNNPIQNLFGDDFGVVVARFSSDPVTISLSDDGSLFTAPIVLNASTAVATGVHKNYIYASSGGPFGCELFVHSLNIADFGLSSVKAIRITADTELDLIRAAGFEREIHNGSPVPEPSALLMLGSSLIGSAGYLLRRRRTA